MFNHAREHKELWRNLENVSGTMVGTVYPWIMQGDFNVILSVTEHSQGLDIGEETSSMRDFQDAVRICDLRDLAYVGSTFT